MISRPGTRLFIVSDFHDLFDNDGVAPLRRLARKTQIVAIRVTDPLEATLPQAGFYAVTDGHSHSQLDTSLATTREAYARDYQVQHDLTAQRLRELRIPLLQIHTDEDPLKRLLTVFPQR